MELIILNIHTLRVHDSSGESKTADKLLALLELVIIEAEKDWGVKVVAMCTDASGESRRARKLLKAKFPSPVTPDCYAHQVNPLIKQFSTSTTFSNASFRLTWLLVTFSSQILVCCRHLVVLMNSSPGRGAKVRYCHSYVRSVENSGWTRQVSSGQSLQGGLPIILPTDVYWTCGNPSRVSFLMMTAAVQRSQFSWKGQLLQKTRRKIWSTS